MTSKFGLSHLGIESSFLAASAAAVGRGGSCGMEDGGGGGGGGGNSSAGVGWASAPSMAPAPALAGREEEEEGGQHGHGRPGSSPPESSTGTHDYMSSFRLSKATNGSS